MGLTKHGDGYMRRVVHGHPRADENGRVLEHILIAEHAYGTYLPDHAIVHHHDGNGENNAAANLVICESQAYHMILHQRQNMFTIGCNPDLQKKCSTCREVKWKFEFTNNSSTWDGKHPECKKCKFGREAIRKKRRRAEAKAWSV